jgi:hypothetical protein
MERCTEMAVLLDDGVIGVGADHQLDLGIGREVILEPVERVADRLLVVRRFRRGKVIHPIDC